MKAEIYRKDETIPFKIIENIKMVSCFTLVTIIHTETGKKECIDNEAYYTMIVN